MGIAVIDGSVDTVAFAVAFGGITIDGCAAVIAEKPLILVH